MQVVAILNFLKRIPEDLKGIHVTLKKEKVADPANCDAYRAILTTSVVSGKINVRGGVAMPPANE